MVALFRRGCVSGYATNVIYFFKGGRGGVSADTPTLYFTNGFFRFRAIFSRFRNCDLS